MSEGHRTSEEGYDLHGAGGLWKANVLRFGEVLGSQVIDSFDLEERFVLENLVCP